MNDREFLAERFEANRAHLQAVAYRMLGSLSEADDAVQEAWLRLDRADTGDVENLSGWLTTVVGRVCMDCLRTRKSRREDSLDAQVTEPRATPQTATDPEQEALLADSVGLALLVVLNRLAPAERIAFVLHDVFDLPFEEIAPIVGRTLPAARQLASRARRRVQGSPIPGDAVRKQSKIVNAFLAAARNGDMEELLAALDPNVVFHADDTAVQAGGPRELRGAAPVASIFAGRAQGARPILIDGAVGVLVAPHGQLRLVLRVTVQNGRITELNAVADPADLAILELAVLNTED